MGTAELTQLSKGVEIKVAVHDLPPGPPSLTPGKQSLLGGQGTTLLIHDKADDQKTSPSGDSGDRIACGAIKSSE